MMATITDTTIRIIDLTRAEMEIIGKEGVVLIETEIGMIALKYVP
jgi:hypothetical protein